MAFNMKFFGGNAVDKDASQFVGADDIAVC